MWRILERYPYSPEGTIIRLAWLQGLSRKELNELTWADVDFEGQTIILADRTIPMEESTVLCLKKRFLLYGRISDRVIIADRGKKPMTPENVSRLARRALESESLNVSLMDLRHDWLLRQIKFNGWAYAARVSGMTVSTLRGEFGRYLKDGQKDTAGHGEKDEIEYALWRVVQQEGNSVAGLAIWMCWKLEMQPGEISALTWNQIDFSQGTIHLPDREVMLGSRMQRLLPEIWEQRKNPYEQKVFVAPTTGHPMDMSRISVLVRTAMVRGGVDGFTLRSLYSWTIIQKNNALLLKQANKTGSLVLADVIRLLKVSENTAWGYLNRLSSTGNLVKVGVRYYPNGSVVAPGEQVQALHDYLEKYKVGSRRDFIKVLRVTPHQATTILRHMVERGQLVRVGKRYQLPENNEHDLRHD